MTSTYQDLIDSGVFARINLCATDPRAMAQTNRAIRMLLLHGSWHGTTRRAQFCVNDYCFTTPACVAAVEGVFNGCRAVDVKTQWYQFLPRSEAPVWTGTQLVFMPFDTIPTAQDMGAGGVLRCYAASLLDLGKTMTFYGHDLNGAWVRTLNAGVMQDGETVALNTPWVDTVTLFKDVSAVRRDVTLERVSVFRHDAGASALTPVAIYEYWETGPSYQRYKVPQFCGTPGTACQDGALTGTSCGSGVVDALVKLEFIPIRRASDFLLIGNIPALELALQALKAKDDGDLATADALLFGDRRNQRLGSVPLLQQELRTMTSDRFAGAVNLFGTAPFKRVMAGFV